MKMDQFFIGYFVESYMEIIRLESEKSNLFRAPKIQGDETPVEKLYNQKISHSGPRELLDSNV